MTSKEQTRNLIIKYLDNSFTEEELKVFLHMIREGDADMDALDDEAMRLWESLPSDDESSEAAAACRAAAHRLLKKSGRYSPRAGRNLFLKIAAVAASVVLLAVGSYYLVSDIIEDRYSAKASIFCTETAAPGQIRRISLPDGTAVTLNVASTLRYNGTFGKKIREVWLSGEAYFDVAEDMACPFCIYSDNLEIHVTGTSFNVKSYPEDCQTSVTVVSGNVGVSYADGEVTMKLYADDRIVIDKSDNSVVRSNTDTGNELSWLDKALVFDNLPLSEAVKMLKRYYGCDISLDNVSSDARLSGTHDNQSIESVLKSICFSTGLSFRKDTDGYVLY